ncbi:MAG: hypothetical protein P4L92_04275 [Rudaea sp.]|nr:hypothetical protein [Rudaea sp.]
MKSAPAIGFDYRPSRLLAAGVAVVWPFAMLALAFCGLPAWSKTVLAVGASAYAIGSLLEFLRPRCARLSWHEAGHWRLRAPGGHEHPAELRHATVLGDVIVLSLRGPSIGKTSILLLPDNCDADTRRRLRVRLARVQAGDRRHA